MTEAGGAPLGRHSKFEQRNRRTFDALPSPFDATVEVGADVDVTPPSEETVGYRLGVTLPTLGAAVAGEAVSDVLEDGWYDTLYRRLQNVSGVTTTSAVSAPDITREDETVSVAFEWHSSPVSAPGEALSLLTFVEGTWMQGVVPGYDYTAEVEALRSRARQQGQREPTPL